MINLFFLTIKICLFIAVNSRVIQSIVYLLIYLAVNQIGLEMKTEKQCVLFKLQYMIRGIEIRDLIRIFTFIRGWPQRSAIDSK